ncbi:MAG: YitT family protein [Anaerolineae bacterium]|nr:YitT family protein [Anaerolineae bacterium]NUQ06982.1 YitT family protein [Anaerolineae bacterium]
MSGDSRSQQITKLAGSLLLLTLGALISAVSVAIFQAPFDIAPAGVSGVAVILNKLIGAPIGLVVLIGNIPIQMLAFRMMGGWKVVAASIFAVVVYSIAIELISPVLTETLSDDRLLNALFGGIVGGIGSSLVIRGGGTMGGTSTLNRILLQRFGIPLSTSTLYTDTGVVLLAGLVFGWEGALYAIVSLYVGGAVTDYALEGPSVIRTAVIITDRPDEVSAVIIDALGRGVTAWDVRGMFTGAPHTVLYVTVARSQMVALRRAVTEADPDIFMAIGQGHTAYGRGFRRLKKWE